MLLSDNTLIRIIINHYFDCQFPFYANKSPLHLTHWTFNVEKKKPTYDLCLFSSSGLYLFIISQISAVCTDGYSVRLRRKTFRIQSWRGWKETKCSSCPRPCRRLHTQCVQQRTEKAQPGRHVEMWASNGGFAPCKHYITLGRHETSVRFKIYILE